MDDIRNIPKVSVSIITYNHEKYIAKAIDSVLAQQTDFDFEIIIGDDFSSDNTVEILKKYRNQYPKIIQLILHPKRYQGVPGRLNNITNLHACRGKYIAMLDGDDYWINDCKLQEQVDFMEVHPEYMVTAADAAKVDYNHEFIGGYYADGNLLLRNDATFTHEDLLKAGWCLTQTSTLLFRNEIFNPFPEWFWNIISADFGLLLLLSQSGKVYYRKKTYTAYRIHRESFMAKHFFSGTYLKRKVEELRTFRRHFLPYSCHVKGLSNLRLSYTLNRKIAVFKYSYASTIKAQEGFISAFRYLVAVSFSDFSGLFFMRFAIRKLTGQRA